MRLIDADALTKEAGKLWSEMPDGVELSKDLMKAINHAPTVATDTNVLGKWIRLTGMAPPEHHGHKICSVCNCLAPYDPIHQWREVLSPYCPSCGAKMEAQNAAD